MTSDQKDELLTKMAEALRVLGDDLLGFWCPGCMEMHVINTDQSDRPAWSFNGNFDAPIEGALLGSIFRRPIPFNGPKATPKETAMKTPDQIRQGDVPLVEVERLPDGARPVPRDEHGRIPGVPCGGRFDLPPQERPDATVFQSPQGLRAEGRDMKVAAITFEKGVG